MFEKRGIKKLLFIFLVLCIFGSIFTVISIGEGTPERRQEVIELLKKGVVETKESPMTIWMISIVAAITIIAFVNYALMKKHKKPVIREFRGKVTASQVLDGFIRKAIAKGHSVEDIKIMLMHRGWPKNLVEKGFRDYQISPMSEILRK